MAKYQEYAEYKDSSIEWLGDVPTDWKCLPIKYLCYVNDGNHGEEYPKESDYTIEELGVPFIRGGNILNFEVTDKDMLYITKEKNTSMRKGRLQVDDILFVNRGDIGKLALISEKHKGANLNSQIAYLRCKDKSINNKFLLYFLASVYVSNLLNSIKMGSVLTQFPIGNILEIKVPLPNSVEQIKISNFLDYETSKIDDLIAKQEKLIELLKEKRQAVISHAVTKGLNPNVPMKDSGVEWLGQVPEHWVKIKLKFIVKSIIDAEHKTAPYFEDGEYLVCRTTNVRNGQLKLDGGKYTNQDTYNEWTQRAIPEIGDILFTREAPAGEACVYDGSVPLCLGQRMVLFKLDQSKVCPDFVLYSIYSGLADDFIKQLSQGSTVTHFNMSDIQNIPLFEPPQNEQIKIKEYLMAITGRYDELISKAESAIQLMQERRTALISAAVTGKIDVRNWQNPNNNNEAKTEFSA